VKTTTSWSSHEQNEISKHPIEAQKKMAEEGKIIPGYVLV
jgi:hypothetical protein